MSREKKKTQGGPKKVEEREFHLISMVAHHGGGGDGLRVPVVVRKKGDVLVGGGGSRLSRRTQREGNTSGKLCWVSGGGDKGVRLKGVRNGEKDSHPRCQLVEPFSVRVVQGFEI